jgi:hypothetical protein
MLSSSSPSSADETEMVADESTLRCVLLRRIDTQMKVGAHCTAILCVPTTRSSLCLRNVSGELQVAAATAARMGASGTLEVRLA